MNESLHRLLRQHHNLQNMMNKHSQKPNHYKIEKEKTRHNMSVAQLRYIPLLMLFCSVDHEEKQAKNGNFIDEEKRRRFGRLLDIGGIYMGKGV